MERNEFLEMDEEIRLSNELAFIVISTEINYESIRHSLYRLLEERQAVAIAIIDNNSDNEYHKKLYDYLNVKIKLLLALS